MIPFARVSAVIGLLFFALLSFWPAVKKDHAGTAQVIDAVTLAVNGETHRLYGVAAPRQRGAEAATALGKEPCVARFCPTSPARRRAVSSQSVTLAATISPPGSRATAGPSPTATPTDSTTIPLMNIPPAFSAWGYGVGAVRVRYGKTDIEEEGWEGFVTVEQAPRGLGPAVTEKVP